MLGGVMQIKDSIAEELERCGFWRRAARRWLVVMDLSTNEDELELIAQRRAICIIIASERYPNRKKTRLKRMWQLMKNQKSITHLK